MDASKVYDPEFRKLINNKKQTVIIPVGSLEQHGAHLPITTDSDIVTEIAARLAKKCGFIVFPAVSYGVSFEHKPLFNTSISPKKFADFLSDIIYSLISNHIISIIILNGHHGNTRFIEQLENSFLRPQTPDMKETRAFQQARMAAFKSLKVRSYSYWRYMKHEFDHAGFVETSLMLAISDKVKMKKAKKGLIMDNLSKLEQSAAKKLSTQPGGFPKVAKNGVWGDPTGATKKDGKKFLAEIVRNLAKECQS
jgi:creatinine amidohydrolase